MLHDAAWSKIADKNETLCAPCFFQRVNERRVPLSLADLLPCSFNLWHWPHSWFNLFASKEPPPTVIDDEWRSAWLCDRRGPRYAEWLDEQEAGRVRAQSR
jgi:hypothetical protein